MYFVQAQFSQVRPVTMAPIAPRMPFYPAGVPGMGQQIMYGQAPPAFISQVITKNLLILFVSFQF